MKTWKQWLAALDPPRFLVLVFLFFIILGAFLLKLSFSTTTPITWWEAFFTATSAMTVTGLVVVDTGNTFTLFGQIVILSLIQIGGLGIMTFAVFIFILLGKRIGMRSRILLQQALNQSTVGGIINLAKKLFFFSVTVEGIASFLLAARWVPDMGWKDGIYASVFHSISAFNNAGFSIWSDSLSVYVADPIVNLIVSSSFILGGLGFTVLFDMWETRELKQLSLHTKLMLSGTLFINFFAMVIIFLLEYDNGTTLGGLSWFGKLQAASFQAVTPRTAGFNTLDIGSLNESTLFFMILLMFVGAGSGSTGGGIKLTTFLTMILSVVAFLRKRQDIVAFRRKIVDKTVTRSLSVSFLAVFLVSISVFILDITEDAPFLTIFFETVSAFGTVGLSMGLTEDLTTIGKLVIMFTMFAGKLGPLTLAFSLAVPERVQIGYPKEDIFTG